jgi:hypothetical protein
MGAADSAHAFLAALEAQQWLEAAALLADDFLLVNGPDGPIYDKATFLAIQRALQSAFPDWAFHLHISREQGNAASGSVYVTGTHTGDFVLPPDMGDATIRATGKPLALPHLDVRFLLSGDLIASMTITRPPGTQVTPLFDEAIVPPSHARLQSMHGNAGKAQRPAIPRIDDLVRDTPFPVYGLLDTPLGLTLQGFGYGSSGQSRETSQLSSVSFRFSFPMASEMAQRTVALSCSDVHNESLMHPPDWRIHPPATPIFDPDGRQYQRYPDLAALRAATASREPYLIDRFPIADALFAARIQRWKRPDEEWQFLLQGEAIHLSGSATDISEDELFTLLERHLGIVTDKPDVLARYRTEFDEWQRFFRTEHNSQ